MKARPNKLQDNRQKDAVIAVKIQPRASKNEICRTNDGLLKIRLTAPPVDGEANEALVRFLAEILSVAKSQVEIVSGHASREKRIRIKGVASADIDRLLNAASK